MEARELSTRGKWVRSERTTSTHHEDPIQEMDVSRTPSLARRRVATKRGQQRHISTKTRLPLYIAAR
jgi:hypothetical protein